MTNVHIVILGLLCDKPLHGYELKHIIEEHMGDWTDIKFGSIYFALGRLKDEGKVEVLEEAQSGNRPVRKVYCITDKGRQEYMRLLRELWKDEKRSLYSLDIAMFFMHSLPQDEILRYIETRVFGCEQALKHVKAHEEEQNQNVNLPKQARYIFEHTKMHLEAELDWLKMVAEELKS